MGEKQKLAKAMQEFFSVLSAEIDAMILKDEMRNGQWVALCFDTEVGDLTFFGPFNSPQEAQQYGEEHDASVNRDEPNPKPILTSVFALWKAEDEEQKNRDNYLLSLVRQDLKRKLKKRASLGEKFGDDADYSHADEQIEFARSVFRHLGGS